MEEQSDKINPDNKETEDDNIGLPGLFKTWNQLYVFVIVQLVVIIGLFYWFSNSFN